MLTKIKVNELPSNFKSWTDFYNQNKEEFRFRDSFILTIADLKKPTLNGNVEVDEYSFTVRGVQKLVIEELLTEREKQTFNVDEWRLVRQSILFYYPFNENDKLPEIVKKIDQHVRTLRSE